MLRRISLASLFTVLLLATVASNAKIQATPTTNSIKGITSQTYDIGSCTVTVQNQDISASSYKNPDPSSKPDYLSEFTNPFGLKVTRITGNPGETIPSVGGTWENVARHSYNNMQAWNADMSLVSIDRHYRVHKDPIIFLDANTYEPLYKRDIPHNNRWHASNPKLRIYLDNDKLKAMDVTKGL